MDRRCPLLQMGDGLAAQTLPLHGVGDVRLAHTMRTQHRERACAFLYGTVNCLLKARRSSADGGRLRVSAESIVLVLVLAVSVLLMLALLRLIAIGINATLPELPGGGEQAGGLSVTPRERAEELLREMLDEREYQQMRKQGYIDVVSPSNVQRIYRIPRFLGRVCVYEDGQAVRELCIQPVEPIPSADVIVMHKLMIQGDEEQYLAQANQSSALIPGRRYQP